MNDAVARHYTGDGDLAAQIAERLRAAGKTMGALSAEDLASVDEFHIRGRPATLDLIAELNLAPSDHLLDLGAGLGGPARTVAERVGCQVTGVDLTPSFVAAARTLSEWTRLSERTRFEVGDATALSFEDGAFDAAMTVHVAMNIAAKDRLYAEAKRVVKPGGVFVVYDVLQGEGGAARYPAPWARTPETSHLATTEEMRGLLAGAGFTLEAEADWSDDGLAWFRANRARAAAGDGPSVTFRAFLGDDFPTMVSNMIANLDERRVRAAMFRCRA